MAPEFKNVGSHRNYSYNIALLTGLPPHKPWRLILMNYRLLTEYISYYHEDRTHLGLGKDTPVGRVPASVPSKHQQVISWQRLGGLHHRYTVVA